MQENYQGIGIQMNTTTEEPKVCPKCRSPYWNTPRKSEKNDNEGAGKRRNKASFGVAEKCGYKYEGKFREDSFSEHFNNFRNTLVYSKLKSEYKEK